MKKLLFIFGLSIIPFLFGCENKNPQPEIFYDQQESIKLEKIQQKLSINGIGKYGSYPLTIKDLEWNKAELTYYTGMIELVQTLIVESGECTDSHNDYYNSCDSIKNIAKRLENNLSGIITLHKKRALNGQITLNEAIDCLFYLSNVQYYFMEICFSIEFYCNEDCQDITKTIEEKMNNIINIIDNIEETKENNKFLEKYEEGNTFEKFDDIKQFYIDLKQQYSEFLSKMNCSLKSHPQTADSCPNAKQSLQNFVVSIDGTIQCFDLVQENFENGLNYCIQSFQNLREKFLDFKMKIYGICNISCKNFIQSIDDTIKEWEDIKSNNII